MSCAAAVAAALVSGYSLDSCDGFDFVLVGSTDVVVVAVVAAEVAAVEVGSRAAAVAAAQCAAVRRIVGAAGSARFALAASPCYTAAHTAFVPLSIA